MAKGFNEHKERLAAIQGFGKVLAKRAGFICEWCGGNEGLKPYDLAPEREVEEETLALLCEVCRGYAGGGRVDADQVRGYEGALWHALPLIAEGAARVLARTNADWAWEAIDGSGLDDTFKAALQKTRRH
ncbi:MAG: hypothetical protein H7338_20755 [Candidatus Sericytochromatia bacterium]|nr:hypothetical protein [Candidatus Sericytochromatia bacterium]